MAEETLRLLELLTGSYAAKNAWILAYFTIAVYRQRSIQVTSNHYYVGKMADDEQYRGTCTGLCPKLQYDPGTQEYIAVVEKKFLK